MTEHTKEPWELDYMGSDESDVCAANGVSIICGSTGYMSDADARRIVACVNACAGIETEVFEAVDSEYQDMAVLVDGLIEQRDELLAALKEVVANARSGATRYAIAKVARAAIAKATGETNTEICSND